MCMKTFYFQTEVKSFERVAEGVKIKGFASTPDLDRQYDIVVPTAFKRSLEQYIKDGISPALLRSHDSNYVVGKILMDGEDAPVITDAGLIITALVTEAKTAAECEAGEMQTFSIGYIPAPYGTKYELRGTGKFSVDFNEELKVEVRIINDLDWIETSIVSTPANPKAIFSLAKSAKSFFDSFPSSIMKAQCEFCPDKKSSCGMIGKKNICSDCVNKMEFKGEAASKVEKGATIHSVIFAKKQFDKADATKVCSEKGFKSDLCVETENAFVFGQMEEKIESEKLETATSETDGLSFLMVKEVEEVNNDEKVEEKQEEETTAPSTETVETPAETQDEAKPENGEAQDGQEEEVIVSPEQKETLDYLAKVFTQVSEKVTVKTETAEEKKVGAEVKTQSSLDLLLPVLSAIAQKFSHLENALGEVQEMMTKLPAPRGKGMISFQHSVSVSEKQVETKEQPSLLNAFRQARSGKMVSIGSDE